MSLNPSIIEQINNLKAQVTSRGLTRKCKEIVAKEGKLIPKKHGDTIIYDLPSINLVITYDTYILNMRVVFNSIEVFRVHSGEIITYRSDIPNWESYIETLYVQLILPIVKKQSLTEQKTLESSIKEHWGISIPGE